MFCGVRRDRGKVIADDIAALHRQLSTDKIRGLNAVRAFVNGRYPDIAIILGGASFLDKAHAAMHLNAQRRDFTAHVGAIGFGKRR